jgi:peroxiredoxin
MRRFALLTVVLLALKPDASSQADTAKEKSAPRRIEPFSLPDTSGTMRHWKDLRGKKGTIVVFLGTECPINNAYAARLAELHAKYDSDAVRFVAINSNRHDTPARVAGHAKEYGLKFPVLKDAANVIADRFGATRTPETFLLGADGTILYHGRIDDQIGVGFKRPAPTRRDLVEALEEVIAGKPVSHPSTPATGCLIARAITPKAEGSVTYTKHVSRILQKNCQECHRPGQIGPMPLLSYEDALSWSGMIKEVINEKRMPPWLADPKHGKFANDRSLSESDRKALLGWIEQGCPKGDGKEPPARSFAEGWTIGKPDAVFKMREPSTVVADAGPEGLKYRYFRVDTNFKEDMWIQAAEAKPGNREVVHHIIVYAIDPAKGRKRGSEDDIGEGFLTAFAPGDMPAIFPAGTAKRVPKGAVLVFQMHYTPNGKEQTDQSSIGLIFAKEPPKYEVRTRSIAQRVLLIPPGSKNYEAKSVTTFKRDTELVSMFPHMHLRGKDFNYRVVFPDGKSETLLFVPRYDFAWQSNFILKDRLKLPAGTRIECVAHFDNSKDNPNNPNASKWVMWGDQTWEEMMIGFVDYVNPVAVEKK